MWRIGAKEEAETRVQDREAEWAGLMRAAIAGDEAAYRRLLNSLAPVLRATARRALSRTGKGEGDSEDIVQETLLAIHLKRHTWDPARPIGPWVARDRAQTSLIDHLPPPRRPRRRLPIEGFEEVRPAADRRCRRSRRATSRPTSPRCPSRQRDVVRCILREEISIRDTAARLKISEGAVRVALHRGLAMIAKTATGGIMA